MTNYMRPTIPPELRERMNDIGGLLDDVFDGKGFALLVFDFGPDGMMNYISNAERDDMLAAMREFIASHEGSAHDAPKDVQ